MFGLNERANINIKADGWWEAGTVQTIYTGTELFQWVSIYNPKILITWAILTGAETKILN